MADTQDTDLQLVDAVSLFRNRIEESLGLIQLMTSEQRTEAWSLWQQATSMIVGMIPDLDSNKELVIHVQQPSISTVQKAETQEIHHVDEQQSVTQAGEGQTLENPTEFPNAAVDDINSPENQVQRSRLDGPDPTVVTSLAKNDIEGQNILLIDKDGQVLVEPIEHLPEEFRSDSTIVTEFAAIPKIEPESQEEEPNPNTCATGDGSDTRVNATLAETMHESAMPSPALRKSTRTPKINPNSPLAGIMARLRQTTVVNNPGNSLNNESLKPLTSSPLVSDNTSVIEMSATAIKTETSEEETECHDGDEGCEEVADNLEDAVPEDAVAENSGVTVEPDGTVTLLQFHSGNVDQDKENETNIAVELVKLSRSVVSVGAIPQNTMPGMKRTPTSPKSRGPYQKRIKLHSSFDDTCKCPTCDKTLANRSNLAVHMRVHSGERPFQCSMCEKSFTTKPNLQRHERTHFGEKPFECPECLKRFTEKKSMIIHQRSHTGEKPYKCEKCGTCFTQQGSLKAHQHLHTGFKGHLCQVCGKSFRQKSQLRTHMLRHTNTRNFQCKFCSKAFVSKGDLERHWLHHTGERPFLCSLCPRTFTRLQYLNEHMNAHTGSRPYMCKVCGERFADVSSCSRHTKRHETSDHSRYIKKESGSEFIVVECEADQVLETVQHLQESTGETLMLNGDNVYISNSGSLEHADGQEIADVNLSIPVNMLDKPSTKSEGTEEEMAESPSESNMSAKLDKQGTINVSHGGGDRSDVNPIVSNIDTLIDGATSPNVTLLKSDETLDDALLEEAGESHTVTIVTKDGSQHIIELPASMRTLSAPVNNGSRESGGGGDNRGGSDHSHAGPHTLLLDGHTSTIQIVTYPMGITADGVPAEEPEITTDEEEIVAKDLDSIQLYEEDAL